MVVLGGLASLVSEVSGFGFRVSGFGFRGWGVQQMAIPLPDGASDPERLLVLLELDVERRLPHHLSPGVFGLVINGDRLSFES